MLHYCATLNSFMRFREQQDITLSEMDADMMKSYESHGGVAELVLGLPYGAFSAVFVSLQAENKSNT